MSGSPRRDMITLPSPSAQGPRPGSARAASASSPRDLHPIKFFLTQPEDGPSLPAPSRPSSRNGPLPRTRGPSPAHHCPSAATASSPPGRLRGSNPVMRELAQLDAQEDEEEGTLNRSKSDGGVYGHRANPNPILRELEHMEDTYNRSHSVGAIPVPGARARDRNPQGQNPILRELGEMEDEGITTGAAVESLGLPPDLKRVVPKPSKQRLLFKEPAMRPAPLEIHSSEDDDDEDSPAADSGDYGMGQSREDWRRKSTAFEAAGDAESGSGDASRPQSQSTDLKAVGLEHMELLRQSTVHTRGPQGVSKGLRNTMRQGWQSLDATERAPRAGTEADERPAHGQASTTAGHGTGMPRPLSVIPKFMLSPRRPADGKEPRRGWRNASMPGPTSTGNSAGGRGIPPRGRSTRQDIFGASLLQKLEMLDARNLLRRPNTAAPRVTTRVQLSESSLQPGPRLGKDAANQYMADQGFGTPSMSFSGMGLSQLQQLDLADCRG